MVAKSNYLLVHDNGRVEPLQSFGAIRSGIALLSQLSTSRIDSAGNLRSDMHARSFELIEKALGQDVAHVRADAADILRNDAGFSATLGNFNPRDLTYKFKRAMEEKLPPLSSTRVFPINSEVPAGALKYEQYRTYSTGEAIVYRGGSGSDIPVVGLGQATFDAHVVYCISKAAIDWLENLRIGMTGLDTQARKMLAMRRVIEELENKWTFNGSEAHGLYGLLNHPYVDTALSSVSYIDATPADDIVSDFGFWANYAENESASTFQPNTLLIAPKLANALRNRRYGDNADRSILDWMLSANPHITKVEPVRELNDAGGAGIHGLAFIRSGASNADSSVEIIKTMTPTLLPPDRRSLVTELFMVSGCGGLNQRETGDNLIVYVQGV